MEGRQLSGFDQLARKKRAGVLPDCGALTSQQQQKTQGSGRRREGGKGGEREEKEETEAKNSSRTSGRHTQWALPAIFYFTTVPASTRLTSHPLFLTVHYQMPLSKA